MHLLCIVLVVLGTCFMVQAQWTAFKPCLKCEDCPGEKGKRLYGNSDQGGICYIKNGFCVTKISIEGKVKRGCSSTNDDEDLWFPGCKMTDENFSEKKVRSCRCDEDECNTAYAEYVDEDDLLLCLQCTDCPKTAMEATEVPCAVGRGGFCVTKVASDGRIDRECIHTNLHTEVGCFMQQATSSEKKARVCLCDEENCNNQLQEYVDDDPPPHVAGKPAKPSGSNNSSSLGVPWWVIMCVVLGPQSAIFLPLMC